MTYSTFEGLILSKTINRTTLPADGSMVHRLQTALEHVGQETLPIVLQFDVEPITGTWRYVVDKVLNTETFLRKPIASVVSTDEVDMDEELLSAVALYIMAGLERTVAGTHMSLYKKEIDLYNNRQIANELHDETQDATAIGQFGTNTEEAIYGFKI